MATAPFPFAHDQQQYEWRSHNAMAAATHQQHFNRIAALSNASATSAAMVASEQQASLLSTNDPQLAEDNRRTVEWIAQLLNPATREQSLLELSKKREQVPELALVLWHSFGNHPPICTLRMLTVQGVMTALLQEIISVYPLLNPSQLTAAASNRVCNALALLQCVASHNETRQLFLNGESCSKVVISG
jgi:CCR4-NOT transcription complex subunit 9